MVRRLLPPLEPGKALLRRCRDSNAPAVAERLAKRPVARGKQGLRHLVEDVQRTTSRPRRRQEPRLAQARDRRPLLERRRAGPRLDLIGHPVEVVVAPALERHRDGLADSPTIIGRRLAELPNVWVSALADEAPEADEPAHDDELVLRVDQC